MPGVLQVTSSGFGKTVDKSELISKCASVADVDVQKFSKTICRAPQALGLSDLILPSVTQSGWKEECLVSVQVMWCPMSWALQCRIPACGSLCFTWLWHSLRFCLPVLYDLHLNYSLVQHWDVLKLWLKLLPGWFLALFTPGCLLAQCIVWGLNGPLCSLAFWHSAGSQSWIVSVKPVLHYH